MLSIYLPDRNCKASRRWFRRVAAAVGSMVVGGLLVTLVGGCSSDAINPHLHNTFLNSRDLIAMTDQMAASLARSPTIAKLASHGPLVVVLTPLKNETNSIITRGQGAAFLHRVRLLLARQPELSTRFVFVVTRRNLQDIRAQSVSQSTMPRRLTPQYALQAVFYADTNVAPKVRTDYYLCTFVLTNIRSGQMVWQGSYETRKVARSSFLY